MWRSVWDICAGNAGRYVACGEERSNATHPSIYVCMLVRRGGPIYTCVRSAPLWPDRWVRRTRPTTTHTLFCSVVAGPNTCTHSNLVLVFTSMQYNFTLEKQWIIDGKDMVTTITKDGEVFLHVTKRRPPPRWLVAAVATMPHMSTVKKVVMAVALHRILSNVKATIAASRGQRTKYMKRIDHNKQVQSMTLTLSLYDTPVQVHNCTTPSILATEENIRWLVAAMVHEISQLLRDANAAPANCDPTTDAADEQEPAIVAVEDSSPMDDSPPSTTTTTVSDDELSLDGIAAQLELPCGIWWSKSTNRLGARHANVIKYFPVKKKLKPDARYDRMRVQIKRATIYRDNGVMPEDDDDSQQDDDDTQQTEDSTIANLSE